jgi:FkbM family methyltransferase
MIKKVLKRLSAIGRPPARAEADPTALILSRVRSNLGRSAIVVEAGAHNGSDTARLSRCFGSGTVHAFEPVPELFSKMVARTLHLSNVRRYNIALGASSGDATLYLSGGTSDASSSLLKPIKHLDFHPDVTFDHALPVRCMSLDDWAATAEVEKVDFIWFDLQGMEADVLKASSTIFPKVRMIYSEVSLVELYKGCPVYQEYRGWLESFGFAVLAEDLRWVDGGNVLFAR